MDKVFSTMLEIKQEGITEYDICNMQELNVNKAGQIYGSMDLGADLIPAKGIDGVIGYISKEELEAPMVHTIEEVLEQNKNAEKGQIIPLYDCEGEVIGGFCAGFVSGEEIEAYRNELKK